MKPIRSWLPESVRGQLLLAFSILFASAMVLGLVGWWGMHNTRDALQNLQSQALPGIARSLEFAQRTASLAAAAPYVAESHQPFQLQSEADALRARMREVASLAEQLPHVEAPILDLKPSLTALDAAIEGLIEVTRSDLFLREDLRERLFQLDSGRALAGTGGPSPGVVDGLYGDLVAAASMEDPDLLASVRQRVRARLDLLGSSAAHEDAFQRKIRSAADGPASIFALRQRQFALLERKAFLLARTRAEADRLAERVDAYVAAARSEVDRQGVSVNRALRSGIVGIAVLTLMCVVVATLGTQQVDRMVRALVAITRRMSRLAEGDIEQKIPALERRDELGALSRAFEVFRDNALAVQAMAIDLKEQGRLLANIFDNIKDGLSVFDREGRLVTCNSQYPALLELPTTAVVAGTPITEIQSRLPPLAEPTGAAPLTLASLNLARQQAPSRFELAYPGGKVIELRSNPMPGGGFVTLSIDLTERRAVEAQLRQAQKMEVLGQLTGGVAHDFNNLLAALTGNLYLLAEMPDLPDKGRRYITRARAIADRGAALTSRLLAFARRQPLSPEHVDVDALISELADLIGYSVGPGILLELELATANARTWVDRGQLENALLNLALNARDAMPEGGRLRIRSAVDDSHGGRVRICVSDTGVGITEAMQERVFEPFFTTKEGAGSGLGLSIVYGFARQSGGDISLISTVGEGTTFQLSLPAHPVVDTLAASAPQPLPALPAQRVLLVEDDPDLRDALADALAVAGHRVVTTADQAQALAAISVSFPDLVLSDVDLGQNGNGVALARELAVRFPGLPCILMSGLPADLLGARFELPPDIPLLAKPFLPEALDRAIGRALGKG